MTPTLTQIRAALQNLAAKKGRPDYELCTAKQVRFALENGLDHHLIAQLPFFEIKQKEQDKPLVKEPGKRGYATDAQVLEVVIWLKNFNGLYSELAQKIGCDCAFLSNLKAKRRNVTLNMYERIMRARNELEVAA